MPRPVANAVGRTFRRILSGDDEGRPAWVLALGEPGDAGWFGPTSTAWQVNGSLATLVGGVRALLLQACHPLALAGVEQHSNYREDPLDRLQRTNRFVTTTTFGSSVLAKEACARVSAVHESVFGAAPDGRSYSATDPHLLLWVHVGLVDSMLVAAQHYHGEPVNADAYVAEMAVTGRAVGVLQPPESEVDLREVLASFRDELSADDSARDVSRFLQFPGRALPFGAWVPYAVLSRAAVDLLPDWAAETLDAPHRSAATRASDAATCRAMLHVLQRVLGTHSQAALLSYARVGVAPRPQVVSERSR